MKHLELGILADAVLTSEHMKNYVCCSFEDVASAGVDVGISTAKVSLIEQRFNTNPDDDRFVFYVSVRNQGNLDNNSKQHRIEYSRKELTEVLSDLELTKIMLISHINGLCKIDGDFDCWDCEHQERCSDEREAAASARIPKDADLEEVRVIMESPEYYEGIMTRCLKINEAVALRLLPEDKANVFLHQNQS